MIIRNITLATKISGATTSGHKVLFGDAPRRVLSECRDNGEPCHMLQWPPAHPRLCAAMARLVAEFSWQVPLKLLVAFSREPSILQALFNRRAGSGTVSCHTVLNAHKAVILTRKSPNKCLHGRYKVGNSATNSASEMLAARELSNTYAISCHVMWITSCLVWSSECSSLMEARYGSLESASETLSIRPHLVL